MKIKQLIPLGAAACLSFAAAAQQDSPFTPTVTAQTTAGGPIVLNLSGVTVTDQNGQPVGPIQHILLSPAGCVDMAVLSMGGDRLVPVPWTLVNATTTTRGQTEVVTRPTLALKVDRQVLQQAPTVTINQLSQAQTIVQVRQYFTQVQQQGSATGGTSSQTNVNTGAGGSTTNQTSSSTTNASAGNTNQTGILSPTGPTNSAPGRPAYETNRPGRRVGPPEGRPPYGRGPANRPTNGAPPSVPGPGNGVPGGQDRP